MTTDTTTDNQVNPVQMVTVTTQYSLSEAGRRAALLAGIKPTKVQEISIDLPADHPMVGVDPDGSIYLCGWTAHNELFPRPLTQAEIRTKLDAVAIARAEEKAAEATKLASQSSANVAAVIARKTASRMMRVDKPTKCPECQASLSPLWYDGLYLDFPHCYPDSVQDAAKALPEYATLKAELDAANAKAEANAIAKSIEAHVAADKAKAAADASETAERIAWIGAHGSPRLRRMLAEGFDGAGVYRDERLAIERPGWAWDEELDGQGKEARNPSEAAFELLDSARADDPKATLEWWVAQGRTNDEGETEEAWKGYVAVAEFLGRKIVKGTPEFVHL